MLRNLFSTLLLLFLLSLSTTTCLANPAPLPRRHSHPQHFQGRYQYASWTLTFYSSGYYEAHSHYNDQELWTGCYGHRDNVFTIRETNAETHTTLRWTLRRDQLEPTP
jgi:hypothetical protein